MLQREAHPYRFGEMTIVRLEGNRFRLEGNWSCTDHSSDHFQLIYEALEMASVGQDKFAHDFADMCAELMNMTADWEV